MSVRRWRWMAPIAALAVAAAACSSSGGGDETQEPPEEEAVTDEAAADEEPADLADAVVAADDPWAPGALVIEDSGTHELDVIWPADTFPDELAAYEDAGFVDGQFVVFGDGTPELGGFSAAHQFDDAEGASAALGVLGDWHREPANAAIVFGLEATNFSSLDEIEGFPFGDDNVVLVQRGDVFQVVIVIWQTDNVVHLLRAVMPAGDDAREDAVFDLAAAVDARQG